MEPPQESSEMYREHILEHFRHPHNKEELEEATYSHRKHNPLCGDDITIQLKETEGKVEKATFTGHGCAISVAAASLLTDKLKGMSIDAVKEMKAQDLIDLLGIHVGPVRMKCALLPLEATHKALGDDSDGNA
jgi:nitrogen fixation NifU-like protein